MEILIGKSGDTSCVGVKRDLYVEDGGSRLNRTGFLISRYNGRNAVSFLVNDQLDALFSNVSISTPLHVSSSKCSSSGGPTFINTPSGITH